MLKGHCNHNLLPEVKYFQIFVLILDHMTKTEATGNSHWFSNDVLLLFHY